MKHSLVVLWAVWMVAGGMGRADEGKTEWSVRSYACPGDLRLNSFVMPRKKSVDLPEAPATNAGSEGVKDFIKRSSAVFRDYLPELPEGSLVVLDWPHHTLAARTTTEGHAAIQSMLEVREMSLPKMVTIQVTMLEVPVSEAAALLRQSSGVSDHRRVLEKLEKDGARVLASAKLETKSGQRAAVEMVSMVEHVTKYAAREDGAAEGTSREQEPVGLKLELDPVVDSYGEIIDLDGFIQLTEKAGMLRLVPLGTLAGKRVEGGVLDFASERWTIATTLRSGQSRMLGVCPGTDAGQARLCFLTASCPRVQFSADGRAEGWLRTYGDEVEPVPAETVNWKSRLAPPEGMLKKKFRVPTEFLSFGAGDVSDNSRDPVDPFAPGGAPQNRRKFVTAKQVLEEEGIPFPEGSSVELNRLPWMITVINTPENLKLVEDYVDSILVHWPHIVQFRVHVVEAPSAVVRKLARQSLDGTDHREAWEALQAEVAAGRGRMVAVGAIETKSGQRCALESGLQYAKAVANLTPQLPQPKDDKESTVVTEPPVAELKATVERVPLGFRLEIDPALASDGRTIDVGLTVERESREPLERFEAPQAAEGVLRVDAPAVDFHPQKLTTALTTFDGMWRMIGTWQPAGADGNLDPDVMQAVFLQAVVMKVAPEE